MLNILLAESFKWFNQWYKSLMVIMITHNLEHKVEEQFSKSSQKIESDTTVRHLNMSFCQLTIQSVCVWG